MTSSRSEWPDASASSTSRGTRRSRRGEQVVGDLPVVARRLGVDELLVGAQLAQRGGDVDDLLRGVEPFGAWPPTSASSRSRTRMAMRLVWRPLRSMSSAPASQLGVVDRQRDPLVGGEQVVHHHRVAVEVLGHGVDVARGRRSPGSVSIVGPQGVELVQLVERRPVGRLDVAAPGSAPGCGTSVTASSVDAPGLGVVLDREGEGVLRVEQVDRGGVALVLEDAEQADRADGRLGQGPLLAHPVARRATTGRPRARSRRPGRSAGTASAPASFMRIGTRRTAAPWDEGDRCRCRTR